MLERKEKKLQRETVRLFIVLFISLFYTLFKFSAVSISMPKIHSIPLVFRGSFGVDNGDSLQVKDDLGSILGIICDLGIIFGWGSFAVLYSTDSKIEINGI